jgi:hypothetical protein
MTFLNPLLLMGLAAAVVPLVIHLLTRRRPKRTEFSSVEFLREVRLAEMRRFRLREWLLLLLRVLAVACLALALARPALQGDVLPGRGTTTALLLIDRSLSMAALEGDGTLFERARTRALEVLDALEAGDQVQVMIFDDGVQEIFPQPVEDHSRARAALEGIEVGGGATDIEAALSAAIEALAATSTLNRELYVFTDWQRAGAAGEVPGRELPQGLRVHFLSLAERPAPPNRTLSQVRYRPGDPPSIDVRMRSFGEGGEAVSGAGPAEVPVTAQAQTEPGRWLEVGRGFLPARSRGGGLVILRERVEVGGRVELASDALPEDDRRAFVAGQAGAVRAGLVSQGRALSLVLETGADAGGFVLRRFEPTQIAPGSLAGVDVLILDDIKSLSEGSLQAVVDFVRAGGGLALILGPQSDPAFLNGRLFPALGDLRIEGSAPQRSQGGGWSMRRAAVGHPAFAGFTPGTGEALSQAEFRGAWQLDPGAEGRVLARFTADLPAVIERERVLIFTSDVEGEWSDFMLSGTFLPFWLQALGNLAHGQAAELTFGERLDVPVPAGEGQAVWSLRTPRDRELPVQVRLAGGAPRLLSPPLEELGLYLLVASGRVVRAVAVTPELTESDLTRLTQLETEGRWEELTPRVVAIGIPADRVVREGRYGRELWREFLVLALIFLLGEMTLARLWGARAKSDELNEIEPAAPEPRVAGGSG